MSGSLLTSAFALFGFGVVVLIVACDSESESARVDVERTQIAVPAPTVTAPSTPRPAPATAVPILVVSATGGVGVSLRDSCSDGARTGDAWAEGSVVELVRRGSSQCEDWSLVEADGSESWVRDAFLAEEAEAPTATAIITATPAPTATATAVATPDRSGCDPSYPTVCIPRGAADYDCAGGSGNGPNYIRGPIRVLSPDLHRLDRDGDGVGCE